MFELYQNKNPTFFTQFLMQGTLNKQQWKDALTGELPGEEAQLLMAPDFRGEVGLARDPIRAAVLALMYPLNGKTGLVFMKRNAYDGPHSAQVSFPGGAREEGDDSLAHTAIRETREELGVKEEIEVFGPLTELHIPVSNFLVTPFAGYTDKRPDFQPDPSEVQYIIETTVEDLLNPDNRRSEPWELHGQTMNVPFYTVGREIIWGATAMMLSEFLQLVSRLPEHPH